MKTKTKEKPSKISKSDKASKPRKSASKKQTASALAEPSVTTMSHVLETIANNLERGDQVAVMLMPQMATAAREALATPKQNHERFSSADDAYRAFVREANTATETAFGWLYKSATKSEEVK